MTTTMLPDRVFEVLCDDSEFALSHLEDSPDGPSRLGRPAATGLDLATVIEAQRARQLATANEELRRTLDAIPHAITILGPDGKTLGANAFVLDYTGLSLEEIRADDSHVRRFHPDDVARVQEERRKAFLRGQPFEAELRARRRDGQYRWFLIRYHPVRDDDGTIIRWFATGTDIDDRQRADDRVRSENLALREEVDRSSMFEEIVGASRTLRMVLSHVSKVAPTDSTVLVTGETGTGKELIARAIHKRSPRAARAFVAVNCAAIPSSLIASELFGHEKGAFTGALQRRQGRFELADGGTHLPRRGRRAARRDPGHAAARVARARIRACRWQRAHPRERSRDCRNESRSGSSRRRRHLPRGPLLSAQRVPAGGAPAPRAPAGYSAARRVLHPSLCQARGQEDSRPRRRDVHAAPVLRLAGQHPRVAERHRARGDRV